MKKILGLILLLTACNYTDSPRVKEFVCERDGKLSERHVGVADAAQVHYGVWRISYTEGNEVTYIQERGESCAVEVVQ